MLLDSFPLKPALLAFVYVAIRLSSSFFVFLSPFLSEIYDFQSMFSCELAKRFRVRNLSKGFMNSHHPYFGCTTTVPCEEIFHSLFCGVGVVGYLALIDNRPC